MQVNLTCVATLSRIKYVLKSIESKGFWRWYITLRIAGYVDRDHKPSDSDIKIYISVCLGQSILSDFL
jgi:hypothetical protein